MPHPLVPVRTPRLSRRSLGGLLLGLAGTSALAACSPSDAGSTDRAQVFATTLVWGSLARSIGGDHVEVYSAVSRPGQDPHDHEATAQDKLRLSRATVAVVNGGHYDAWFEPLADSLDHAPTVVDAFEVGGHGEDDNEHVFYDLDTALAVVTRLAEALASADATHADAYRANAAALTERLTALKKRATDWAAAHPAAKVVSTESVAAYLLTLLGLDDVTPPEYVRQSESEAGPSAAVVDQTRQLVGTTATMLVVNGQTEDAVSTTLVQRAEQTHTRIVRVFETFPEGVSDYPTFIEQAITAFTGQGTP